MDTAIHDCIPELRTCLDTYTGEEEQQAYLTQHQVSRSRCISINLVTIAQCTHQDGYYQRTTSQAQLHAEAQRNLAHNNTEKNTKEDGTYVRMIQTLHRVTNHVLQTFNALFCTSYEDTVTYLQTQIAVGEKLHTSTSYAGYVNTIDASEVQLTQSFTINFRLGNHQTTGYIFSLVEVVFPSLSRNDFTNHHGNRFGFVLSTNEMKMHILFNDCCSARDNDFAFLYTTRNDKLTVENCIQFLEGTTHNRRISHADHQVLRCRMCIAFLFLFDLFVFLFQLDVAKIAQYNGSQDNTNYTERISTSIAGSQVGYPRAAPHLNRYILHERSGSTETWGIGYRTIHSTNHHGKIVIALVEHQEVKSQHYKDVQSYDPHCNEIHTYTTLFEGSKETRTNLQTDTVDKQDQTEFLDKVDQVFLVCMRNACKLIKKMTCQNTCKKHEGNAKGYTAQLDLAQFDTDTDYRRVKNYEVRNRTGIH
ncbi:hypothetical protein EVA_04517 [gut metagenome]|uniref:Uncharacterized protein n=1 Tax=gut metagenome TaxID=749906 RepID=J9GWI6_9ZZZZ